MPQIVGNAGNRRFWASCRWYSELYRQAEIFARDGVILETSTLCGWVGATAAALQPLVDALAADVLSSETLHVDDTPVPVLAPGTGKTKTGRLWTYVRDERPFAGSSCSPRMAIGSE